MILGRCRRRERDLLALLDRYLDFFVVRVLTGNTQVGRHLSIIGLNQDPFFSYCSAAIECASHFLCHCDYFATLRMRTWGKPDLYPADIDTATVGDIAWFMKNLGDSHWVSSLDWNHTGWLMDLHRGLSLPGDRSLCPILELWNFGIASTKLTMKHNNTVSLRSSGNI